MAVQGSRSLCRLVVESVLKGWSIVRMVVSFWAGLQGSAQIHGTKLREDVHDDGDCRGSVSCGRSFETR